MPGCEDAGTRGCQDAGTRGRMDEGSWGRQGCQDKGMRGHVDEEMQGCWGCQDEGTRGCRGQGDTWTRGRGDAGDAGMRGRGDAGDEGTCRQGDAGMLGTRGCRGCQDAGPDTSPSHRASTQALPPHTPWGSAPSHSASPSPPPDQGCGGPSPPQGTHRAGGSGTSERSSLSRQCSAGAGSSPPISPQYPALLPQGPPAPQDPGDCPPSGTLCTPWGIPTTKDPPRDPTLHPGDPAPPPDPSPHCRDRRAPAPRWDPPSLASPRGSLSHIPPIPAAPPVRGTHQLLHIDQPVQEGLAAFMQEGQIWG